MNQYELTFYSCFPSAVRVTTRDDITGYYEYLCKNDDDANDLLHYLKERSFQHIDFTRLYKEVE